VFVESADPIPQFIIKPRAERASPSEFLLDASATSDVDVDNKVDELSYEREFSSPNMTKITQSEELNKKVVVEFNEVGKQTIKLIVTDKYAKKATITKEIEIKSTLRPKIFSAPKATTWGDNVVFKVTSDKPIANYARDFGDQSERAIQTDSILHKYNQVGVYPVKLKVT
jgi:PKD repeat protein